MRPAKRKVKRREAQRPERKRNISSVSSGSTYTVVCVYNLLQRLILLRHVSDSNKGLAHQEKKK